MAKLLCVVFFLSLICSEARPSRPVANTGVPQRPSLSAGARTGFAGPSQFPQFDQNSPHAWIQSAKIEYMECGYVTRWGQWAQDELWLKLSTFPKYFYYREFEGIPMPGMDMVKKTVLKSVGLYDGVQCSVGAVYSEKEDKYYVVDLYCAKAGYCKT